MKTVITSSGNSTSADFDQRFGRAAWFCVYNEESGETKFLENDHVNDGNGVGIKVAEKMVELEVNKVISGDFGPKAKDMLDKFNVQMVVIQNDDFKVEDVINKLKK